MEPSEVAIEKGIPIPDPVKGMRVYDFLYQLQPGESALVPASTHSESVETSVHSIQTTRGWKFTRKTERDGRLRVWRIF